MSRWVKSRERRRQLVKQMREEGYKAGLAGVNAQNNPYGSTSKSMDAGQWLRGWHQGDDERQAREKEQQAYETSDVH